MPKTIEARIDSEINICIFVRWWKEIYELTATVVKQLSSVLRADINLR